MPDFITRGEFDMSGPDGVILPEFWEDSVEPGMEIRMRPWVTIPIGSSSRSTFYTASSASDIGVADENDALSHPPSPHQNHAEQINDGDSDGSYHDDSSDIDAPQPHILETINESGEDASDNVRRTPISPIQIQQENAASETDSLGRRSNFLFSEEPHVEKSVPLSQPLPPVDQTVPPAAHENNSAVNVDLEEQVVEIPDRSWPSPGQNAEGLWRLDVLAARVTNGAKDTDEGSISTRLMTRVGPPKDSPQENIKPDWHWLYATFSASACSPFD